MILEQLNARKCFIASCLLAFSFLLLPFLPSGEFSARAVIFVYSAVILSAPFLIIRKKMRFIRYLLCVGILLLILQPLRIFSIYLNNTLLQQTSAGIEIIGVAIALFLIGTLMFYSVSEAENREPVFGCILAYLLLGTVFGNIYYIFQLYHPGSFAALDGSVPEHIDLIYYSFVTLTTCGYGDILPKHNLVRMLAVLEMVCGVLYVAIFIGRMLSFSFRRRLMAERGPAD